MTGEQNARGLGAETQKWGAPKNGDVGIYIYTFLKLFFIKKGKIFKKKSSRYTFPRLKKIILNWKVQKCSTFKVHTHFFSIQNGKIEMKCRENNLNIFTWYLRASTNYYFFFRTVLETTF